MNDDPFSDDESARTWQETGPAHQFDQVEVRLTGEVLSTYERHGVDLLRVALGPFEHSRQETIEVRADSVAVVKRYEP
jgi:hypothetical protein